MWAAGRPRQAPPARSTAPPLTQSNQTRWTHLQTSATSGEASEVNIKSRTHFLILTSTLSMKIFNFLLQAQDSPANPPLLLGPPLSCLPWAPHRGLLHPPSILLAFPHGSQVLAAVEDGHPKDKALLPSRNPAPATPPCLTTPPRIDPTTMSASLQWEGAHPAQGTKHRLAWVSRTG